MDKKTLRKHIIEIRDNLNIDEKKSKDENILNNLMDFKGIDDYNNIFCYVNFGSEINTMPIIKEFLQKDKKIYIPYIDNETKSMKLALIRNIEEDLVEGYYNILEPKDELRVDVDNNIIDLVITPGVAFTKDKFRTGYGGGYYDRFFANLKTDPLKIALAYDFQIVDKIPVEDFDIPVDILITDKQIIK